MLNVRYDPTCPHEILARAVRGRTLRRVTASLLHAFGIRAAYRSPYDIFMWRMHGFLKANSDFQQRCEKERIEFPPLSTWMAFTDDVSHAVLSGQFALEQTFIVPIHALIAPEKSPLRVLEQFYGAARGT
jgi:hypothetical protein